MNSPNTPGSDPTHPAATDENAMTTSEQADRADGHSEQPAPTADQARLDRYAALEANTPTLDEVEFYQRSRRSFLVGGLASLAGFATFRTIQTADLVDRAPKPLRTVHEKNEALWRSLFREDHLAKTFDRSESSLVRVNGRKGLGDELDLNSWELRMEGPDGELLDVLTMDDIRVLPKHEHTIEHKCVEGWSHIVTWGGARFSDLADLYRPQLGSLPEYVDLRTPDGEYYVGVDLPTMLHAQTLLTYETEGEALDEGHGAPLRLSTPLKYGIKQIKRIGTIKFSHTQPADYWHERGYDWYSHL